MKKFFGLFLITICAFGANAADYKQAPPAATGMVGDNLNLYVVLNLFKDAVSMEDFERKLNSTDYKANNLDLNNDGSVDYLRVTDYGTGNYHTIVIQDIISASEIQDVAIIDLQKENGNVAHVQIIGDESLYGKDYIIEPQMANANNSNQNTTVINNNYYYNNQPTPVQYVNVWSWPSVNFIFGPIYTAWVSPWHWAYYPTWWNSRPRVIYNVYYGNFHNFGWNNYCRRNAYFNQPYYNTYYNNRRVVSNTVQVNINKNVYNNNGNPNKNYNNGNHYGNNNPKANNTDKGNIQQGSKPKNSNSNQSNGNWNKPNQQNNSNTNNNGENKPKWNKSDNNNGGTKGNWNSNGSQSQTKPSNTNNGQSQQNNPKWNNASNSNGNWNKSNTGNGNTNGWNGNKSGGNKQNSGNSKGSVKTGSRSK